MEHRTVDLDGPVHYADFGGTGRPVVLVHGLGGSYANWLAVGPRLAALGRVYALDLAGHGLTPSLGRTGSHAQPPLSVCVRHSRLTSTGSWVAFATRK